MKVRIVKYALALLSALLLAGTAAAQRMPERRLVRKGNRQFDREAYQKSLDSYRRATEVAPDSFEAAYDLAGAMFRNEQYGEAEKQLAKLLRDTLRSDAERSEVAYNMGNAQFAQQKLREALASYRQAMRLNPEDMEAKYNYAYTKKLLEQQQDDQNRDDQQQNEDKNRQDNQNDGQNDNNEQNNEQNGSDDPQRDKSGDDESQQGDTPQPKGGLNKQAQEAMLDAVQAQEDKTQDKLKEREVIIRGGKNW